MYTCMWLCSYIWPPAKEMGKVREWRGKCEREVFERISCSFFFFFWKMVSYRYKYYNHLIVEVAIETLHLLLGLSVA